MKVFWTNSQWQVNRYTHQNIQELACWIRDNWQPYSTDPEIKPIIKVNAVEVVWQTQCYFQQRTAAAKQVLDNMTKQEHAAIYATVDERRLKFLSKESKYLLGVSGHRIWLYHSQADKHHEKYLQTFLKECWLDIRMATVIFTVYADSQGRLVANVWALIISPSLQPWQTDTVMMMPCLT